MRLKKGFTLAEILIVLMVIGVIATMTVPSLMKGVTEAQYKTGFKKAYNAVVNLTAMERISGTLPSVRTGEEAIKLFAALNANLSVKEYATSGDVNGSNSFNGGGILGAGDYRTAVTFTSGGATRKFGTGDAVIAGEISQTNPSPWIVSEDNLAYAVILPATPSTDMCQTKLGINGSSKFDLVGTNSCAAVVVDVNGLSKGPNRLEPQVISGIEDTAALDTLTGDQYYIYVGQDGAAAGPKTLTVSGRLVADLR